MKKPAALLALAAFMSVLCHSHAYERVDPSTLKGKFMCGYQGWFRTPGDTHFVGTEGMPADWYLRLIKEAKRIIKSGGEFPAEIPIKP